MHSCLVPLIHLKQYRDFYKTEEVGIFVLMSFLFNYSSGNKVPQPSDCMTAAKGVHTNKTACLDSHFL